MVHQTPPSRRPPSARVLAHRPQLRTGGILPRAPLAPKAEGEPALFVVSQHLNQLLAQDPKFSFPPLRHLSGGGRDGRRRSGGGRLRWSLGRGPAVPGSPPLRRTPPCGAGRGHFPSSQRAVFGSFGPPPEMGGGRGQAEAEDEDTEASRACRQNHPGLDQSGRPCPPVRCGLQDTKKSSQGV